MSHTGYKDFWNPLEHVSWSNEPINSASPVIGEALLFPTFPGKYSVFVPDLPFLTSSTAGLYLQTSVVRYRKHGERRGIVRRKRVVKLVQIMPLIRQKG